MRCVSEPTPTNTSSSPARPALAPYLIATRAAVVVSLAHWAPLFVRVYLLPRPATAPAFRHAHGKVIRDSRLLSAAVHAANEMGLKEFGATLAPVRPVSALAGRSARCVVLLLPCAVMTFALTSMRRPAYTAAGNRTCSEGKRRAQCGFTS
jgi:hypothetical protein